MQFKKERYTIVALAQIMGHSAKDMLKFPCIIINVKNSFAISH